MPVQILIGPPATGKTEACIQKIQNSKSNQPLSKIWVLVPDSQNIGYFINRLANAGGGMGVNVGTFSALFSEILEKNRIFTPVISPALEHRLVQETVDTAFTDDALQHYATIRKKPGFIQVLGDVFSELRSAYVHPEQFLEYIIDSKPSRRELAILYKRFIDRLNELKWIDRNGQIWQAISVLQDDHVAGAAIDLLIVDGFSSFAGARQRFLELLSEQVGEMVITFPGKRQSNRQVHQGTTDEIEKLVKRLSPQVIELTGTPHLFSESFHIEKHVLDPGTYQKVQASEPLFLEVYSQPEEAREALRWIKKLVIREGYPLNACAVFAGDHATYRPLVQSAADEFGIKVHFSHPDALIESPAVQSILNFLQLPIEDFQTRALFNALGSPYFDFGLEGGEIDNLKHISQYARIVIGREQWEEAWDALLHAEIIDNAEFYDERKFKDLLQGIDFVDLQGRFSKFWSLFAAIDEPRSIKEWVSWVEDILKGLNFYDRIDEERDQEACTSFVNALKALILSEQVAGLQMVDYAAFLSDLQGTLQSARLDESRASRSNALYIGKMTEARASRWDVVVLMGFSEGIFPVVENPDPFLDETLRHDLGLQPMLEREQASTFYHAFTRANTRLLFTRPYLAEDGEKWEPSHYWESASNLFEDSALDKISQNEQRSQTDAASSQERLSWAVQQGHLTDDSDPDLLERWHSLQQAGAILNARRSKKARGPYEGRTSQLAETLTEKYSSNAPGVHQGLKPIQPVPTNFISSMYSGWRQLSLLNLD